LTLLATIHLNARAKQLQGPKDQRDPQDQTASLVQVEMAAKIASQDRTANLAHQAHQAPMANQEQRDHRVPLESKRQAVADFQDRRDHLAQAAHLAQEANLETLVKMEALAERDLTVTKVKMEDPAALVNKAAPVALVTKGPLEAAPSAHLPEWLPDIRSIKPDKNNFFTHMLIFTLSTSTLYQSRLQA